MEQQPIKNFSNLLIIVLLVAAIAFFVGYSFKKCECPVAENTPVTTTQATPPQQLDSEEQQEQKPDEEIYTNHNISAVQNGATEDTKFTLTQPRTITYIENYHWNSAKGNTTTGTISLEAEDGTIYGPWETSGLPGQGGVPNAYWAAKPNIELPAGTYKVLDSDPDTWSQNSMSGGSGMVRVRAVSL